MSHTIALILAGGTGSRFGSTRPKQFTSVGGRTVLEHSIAAFEEPTDTARRWAQKHPYFQSKAGNFSLKIPHFQLKTRKPSTSSSTMPCARR